MIETIYLLRRPEDNKPCDYDKIADAITGQYYAMPVELRKPIIIANKCDAGRPVAHILERQGKVPVELVLLSRYFGLDINCLVRHK
jgi:hypothetical protein